MKPFLLTASAVIIMLYLAKQANADKPRSL